VPLKLYRSLGPCHKLVKPRSGVGLFDYLVAITKRFGIVKKPRAACGAARRSSSQWSASTSVCVGLALADYDYDGKIDLFVRQRFHVEFLYHNKGHGSFEEVGLLSQVAVDGDGRAYAGMGVDFADYNNDGWPDRPGWCCLIHKNCPIGPAGFRPK